MLTPATVQELQDILKTDFGLELGMEQATQAARDLVQFFETLAVAESRPTNKNDNDTPNT